MNLITNPPLTLKHEIRMKFFYFFNENGEKKVNFHKIKASN